MHTVSTYAPCTHVDTHSSICIHHMHAYTYAYIQAYEEMFTRDSERFSQALHRTNVCPLGSGALAGVAYDVDRYMVAAELDFRDVTACCCYGCHR